MAVDHDKLMGYVNQAVGDFGSLLTAALVNLGDKLGLFKAMADSSPMTPKELADKTGTTERYVREWANGLAAAGYVDYLGDGRYALNEEQAIVFTHEGSPAFILGGFQGMLAATRIVPQAVEAFRTGDGIGWHEHHADLFEGTERFFRPGYEAHLIQEWIPSLSGADEKLRRGVKVADVGCGFGASTIIMAKAYPDSEFWGFDYHEPSVRHAREAASDAGVGDRTTFQVASAKEFPGADYDMVCHFDCLHDMGDPVGAAEYARRSMKADGHWLLVEPFANDDPADNMNPIGRVFYSASTLICTPASLSQEVGAGLGAQAGEGRLSKLPSRPASRHFEGRRRRLSISCSKAGRRRGATGGRRVLGNVCVSPGRVGPGYAALRSKVPSSRRRGREGVRRSGAILRRAPTIQS